MRPELRSDPDAGVGDDDLHVISGPNDINRMRPPDGVNFTAFESRFQAICRRRAGLALTTHGVLVGETSIAIPFGMTLSTAALTAVPGSITSVSGDDARDVEQLVDELRLPARVAGDRLDGAVLGRRRQLPQAHHLGQPEHRVQRRAQLMGTVAIDGLTGMPLHTLAAASGSSAS